MSSPNASHSIPEKITPSAIVQNQPAARTINPANIVQGAVQPHKVETAPEKPHEAIEGTNANPKIEKTDAKPVQMPEGAEKRVELFEKAQEASKSKDEMKVRTKSDKKCLFGITDLAFFVLDSPSKYFFMTTLESNTTVSFKAPSSVGFLFNQNEPMFSTSEGFSLFNKETNSFDKIQHELTNAKMMLIDPLCSQRFFFLNQQKELYIVMRDPKKMEFQTKLYKKDVQWFDVSRKFFLLNIGNNIQLWPRQDTAELIWNVEIQPEIKYYIDDHNFYELRNDIITIKDIKDLNHIVSTVPHVWTLWKGRSVVLELEDSIQVNGTKINVGCNLICADANNEHIAYFNDAFMPSVCDRNYHCEVEDIIDDSAFNEAEQEIRKACELSQTVCDRIEKGKQALLAAIEECREPTLREINKIATEAEQTLSELSGVASYLMASGSSIRSLVEKFQNEQCDPDSVVLKALDLSKHDFFKFCVDANIKDNANKLSQDTLASMAPVLLEALEEDPNTFADIICEVLLEIDTFTNIDLKRELLHFGENLLSCTIGLFQRLPEKSSCMNTIRLLMNIGVSLKS